MFHQQICIIIFLLDFFFVLYNYIYVWYKVLDRQNHNSFKSAIAINNETFCYGVDCIARRPPASTGPNEKAKPKKATHQAKAVTWSSASLHPGSNEAQLRASPATTTAKAL